MIFRPGCLYQVYIAEVNAEVKALGGHDKRA